MTRVDPDTNTTKLKKDKKKKNGETKTASVAADILTTVGPHAQDIANYLAHGTAALGTGALGYVPYKLRKIAKETKGKNRGGAVMKKRGGTFKGTF